MLKSYTYIHTYIHTYTSNKRPASSCGMWCLGRMMRSHKVPWTNFRVSASTMNQQDFDSTSYLGSARHDGFSRHWTIGLLEQLGKSCCSCICAYIYTNAAQVSAHAERSHLTSGLLYTVVHKRSVALYGLFGRRTGREPRLWFNLNASDRWPFAVKALTRDVLTNMLYFGWAASASLCLM